MVYILSQFSFYTVLGVGGLVLGIVGGILLSTSIFLFIVNIINTYINPK